MDLEKLFFCPVYYKNFGNKVKDLNKRLVIDIDKEMSEYETDHNRSFVKNGHTWQSKHKMENRHESFREFADLIESVYDCSCRSVWANVIFGAGGFSRPHNHGARVNIPRTVKGKNGDRLHMPTQRQLSRTEDLGRYSQTSTGVYYPKGLTEIDNLDNLDESKLFMPRWNGNDEGVLVLFDPTSYLRGTNDVATVRPRESLLLLFPAWLTHMVAPMATNKKRYSMSFTLQPL